MSKKKDERQFKIRQLLQEHPKIKISDLSDYFQTSSETIRKDIIELEDSKIIKKEHGYALLLEEPDEMPISLRNQEYIEEKKQIMRQTCTFIKEGMVVYLDAGSTCQAGIPFLQSIHNITIVTNSIFVAYKCAKLNMHVILIGGNISNNAYRSYGNFASETIDYIHIDVDKNKFNAQPEYTYCKFKEVDVFISNPLTKEEKNQIQVIPEIIEAEV